MMHIESVHNFVFSALTAAALLAWLGVLDALHSPPRGWTITGVAIGCGVLAKGPVILVPVLPSSRKDSGGTTRLSQGFGAGVTGSGEGRGVAGSGEWEGGKVGKDGS